MVSRPANVHVPQTTQYGFRGPVYEGFMRPLMEERWDAFPREACVEGGTGTGKTLALSAWLRAYMRRFPGAHILIIRRFKADLPGSWMQTWEDEILDPRDPWDAYMLKGPSRITRQSYRYPNGSTIWLRGMDQWARVKSMAFDLIWCVEGTEIDEEKVQGLNSRLRKRAGVDVPFRMLMFDVNPDHPQHWLNQRCIQGVTKRYTTTIKDNPGFWDGRRDEPTPAGREYLDGLKQTLTDPHMLRRLFHGEWCAATGAILHGYSRETHTFEGRIFERAGGYDELWIGEGHPVLPMKVKIGWYLASVDWGRRHAGTFQLWAVDLKGRQYLIEEYYHSERNILWWSAVAADVARRYGAGKSGCTLKAIVCDNAWPDNIDVMNDEITKAAGPSAAIAMPCKKRTSGDQMTNLEVLRTRFEDQGDGAPAIFMSRNALQHGVDPELTIQRLEEEIPAWCYAPFDAARSNGRAKDAPDPACVDDGLDGATYAAVYIMGGRDFSPRIKDPDDWNPRAADLVNQKTGWKTRPDEN